MKKKKRITKKTWLWEFSKKLLFTLTILFIVERIYEMVALAINGFCGIDTFIQTGAEVFVAGVITYGLKAGIENVFKIKLNADETDDSMPEKEDSDL